MSDRKSFEVRYDPSTDTFGQTIYFPADPYGTKGFIAELPVGDSLSGRILNMLLLASKDVERLKETLRCYRELSPGFADTMERRVLAESKRAVYHRQQRKLWQRRCKAVFRQAHGRAPTVEELDALVAKDWRGERPE